MLILTNFLYVVIQVWHYCDLNGGQASFLCPNGTIFSQVALTCDWWFNVKCASTAQLYVLNERLYKYILPHKPSFPEDFAGPLVDQYLTEKFQELELKKNITTEKPSSTLQVLLNDEINQDVKWDSDIDGYLHKAKSEGVIDEFSYSNNLIFLWLDLLNMVATSSKDWC